MVCVFAFLFCVCARGSYAQNDTDSLLFNGKVQWEDSTINGFPKTLKLTSVYNPFEVHSLTVDTLGHFSKSLLPGKYVIEPEFSYHYFDAFIRIDKGSSRTTIDLADGGNTTFTVVLDTLAAPAFEYETGILHGEFNAEAEQKVDSFIQSAMSYYSVPGASLAIIKTGEVVYNQFYGVTSYVTAEPIDANTLFEAGSITKIVFAFAVMRLVERGVLDLDTPLFTLLPFQDVAHDERYKLITARYVLSHQTGFPNWADRDDDGTFDLLFTPGTEFGYSGEGFEYLKRVLEHITNKPFQQILEEEVLKPLAWENVHFVADDYVQQHASDGQNIHGYPRNNSNITKPMAAFGMFVEARGFSRFALALRNKEGLSEQTYREMLRSHSTEEPGFEKSLGFTLEHTDVGTAYGHSGYMPTSGFICNYMYWPDLDMGYIIFTNGTTGFWLANTLLQQYLITGTPSDS